MQAMHDRPVDLHEQRDGVPVEGHAAVDADGRAARRPVPAARARRPPRRAISYGLALKPPPILVRNTPGPTWSPARYRPGRRR